MSTSLLIFGVLFSAIGLGYFLYGKKQRSVVPLLCGLALMVVPYFISSTTLLVVVCTVCSAIPYFVRL
ncbi:MAG: amino acid transport protein [Betaproteobacteria bacterium]|nr:amino acid transport protein [Betaproteobacteria bacterium]